MVKLTSNCVSTLYDVRTIMKSPNDTFLRLYPRCQVTHDFTTTTSGNTNNTHTGNI